MKKFYFMLLAFLAFSSSVLVGTASAASTDPIIINGHKFVDLGLPSGLLWAETNVGASSATDDGDYFAWGETEPKSSYSWDNYKWGSNYKNLSKYNSSDDKGTLDPEDDAATVNWGIACRMPSLLEYQELCDECDWTWQSNYQGVSGFLVTGNNGNTIFFPASGSRYNDKLGSYGKSGYYWLSHCNTNKPREATNIRFDYSGIIGATIYPLDSQDRYRGFPVRAVANKEATGITTIESNSKVKEIQRYDISGRAISSPQKGINIIRYSDGTTKKVIIK